jgi:FlaA1/EpsC-like NDP-sugar epimerase
LTLVFDLLCFLGVLLLCLQPHTAAQGPVAIIEQNRLIVIVYLVVSAFTFLLFRCYNELIRDYSLFNALKIGGAIAASHIIFGVFMAIIEQPLPFTLILNLAIYAVTVIGIYRLIVLSAYNIISHLPRTEKASDQKRAIIFGAGHAGKYLVDMLNYDKSKKMIPVAFIDDNPKLERRRIKGLLVVGPRMLIPYAAKKYNAEIIVIAIPFVDNSTIREIFNLCCEANCTVKRFGNMSNLAFDGLSKSTINEVRVEDLLQREEVRLDLKSVSDLIKDKVVLVTGGAGSIGSELCRQIMHYGPKLLVILDFNENGLFDISMELKQKHHKSTFEICLNSIRDKDILNTLFGKYKPNIVFHAAAHKHVPMMEGNFREALLNNIVGTQNVVDASIANNVERFMLISTDKAVNPVNIMGATKRVAELIIQRKSIPGHTLFAAVRFGNVLGSHSSVVPIFQKQLRSGGPITVTHKDITRYFMTIPEAVQLVLESASIMLGGETFVLDMGEPVNIYDLATTMIKLSGLEPGKDIKIEVTGLRPGEKLHEELRLPDEIAVKTSNDKIFMLKSDLNGSGDVIENSIASLFENIEAMRYDNAFELIMSLTPSLQERRSASR